MLLLSATSQVDDIMTERGPLFSITSQEQPYFSIVELFAKMLA
jgi:hypothetical protein